jgi:hypothetical protein
MKRFRLFSDSVFQLACRALNSSNGIRAMAYVSLTDNESGETAMERTGCVIKRENTATRLKIAVISAGWFVLSGSAANVCAQNNAGEDRVIPPVSQTVVSEYETFTTSQNPPAIFTEGKTPAAGGGEAASNERIIVNPVMGPERPASVQRISSAPLAVQVDIEVEKVTSTRDESAAAAHAPSVTLWDEIAPPMPAPVPVDAAARSAPGNVASAGAPRTR